MEIDDEAEYNDANVIDNYDVYFTAFTKMYPKDDTSTIIHCYDGDYHKLKVEHGYRDAYHIVMNKVCVDFV